MRVSILRLLGFLVVSGCLFADNLQWGGTYTSVWSGFGTSPYSAIDHSNGDQKLIVFCLDFNDEIAAPYDWVANINPLTPGNVQEFAQFGGNYGQGITAAPFAFTGDALTQGDPHSVNFSASPTAYTRYLEASWLFANILQAIPHGDVNTEVVSQVAAWDLFIESKNEATLASDIKAYNGPSNYTFNNYLYTTNSYSTPPTTQTIAGVQFEDAVDEALKAAQNAVVDENWVSSNYIGAWDLVTGDPAWSAAYGRPVQEFLMDSPPVPEPGAVLLLGTVMAAIVLARRRRLAA